VIFLTEQSLHEQLKEIYAEEAYPMEVYIDDYIVDVLREETLIEIQTGSFNTIKGKLVNLLKEHKVKLVHPLSYHKWIIRLNNEGEKVGRRKSPKKGRLEEMFYELVYIPKLCCHRNFELEVPMVNIEEYWINDGKGSWRRGKWSIHDRKLLHVHVKHLFRNKYDFLRLLPADLPKRFTSREIKHKMGLTKALTQKMIYCYRKMDLVEVTGKKGRSNLYSLL
jgi:hypothetical protein